MKLITKNTDYAVRALCHLAKQDGRVVSVPELVRELHAPRPFLRKILQILNKKDLLQSYKGKSGGFKLAVTADKIFLGDLINILQGPIKLNDCFFKKMFCADLRICLLRKKIDEIEKYVISELESISIASLGCDGKGRGKNEGVGLKAFGHGRAA